MLSNELRLMHYENSFTFNTTLLHKLRSGHISSLFELGEMDFELISSFSVCIVVVIFFTQHSVSGEGNLYQMSCCPLSDRMEHEIQIDTIQPYTEMVLIYAAVICYVRNYMPTSFLPTGVSCRLMEHSCNKKVLLLFFK